MNLEIVDPGGLASSFVFKGPRSGGVTIPVRWGVRRRPTEETHGVAGGESAMKVVEAAVQSVEPDVVCTHHGGDLNIDHAIVHCAVLTATRPLGTTPVRDVLAFEGPPSTEWSFQRFGAFSPNVFVDISDTLELKLRAIACYESEARAFPHPRSTEALAAIAKRWGSVAGCGSAEAFELIRSIRRGS